MAKLGIIAEDSTDIDTLKIFIDRIKTAKFKKKPYAAGGCGKLKRKCQKIAKNWITRDSVTHIVICHDLDCNCKEKKQKLHDDLYKTISSVSNHKNIFFILIPIEEIEAWFLSDIDCLKKKFPGIPLNEVSTPANIRDPKEFIEKSRK